MTPSYRRDIDGLRALAILSVLLFHLEFGSFSGGWVGVDIFFVISGYLITQKIASLIQNGQFSLATFLASRARRILPSYFMVVTATLIAACLIFNRAYIKSAAGEAFASTLGLANLYFWREGNYFNLSSHLRPLLHLWSLGVEMQFYLSWPLTLLVLGLASCNLKKYLLATAATLFTLSILLAQYFAGANQEATFFLPQFRVFEFMTGALLVSAHLPEKLSSWLSTTLETLGISLIAYAIVFFDQSTPYPSFYALIPCLGAYLLLATRCEGLLGCLINNPIMAAIGKISYCLYLVHWPLIVFFLYQRVEPLSALNKLAILGLSFILATLLHYCVEIPIWKQPRFTKLGNEKIALACCAFILFITVPSAILWNKGALSWRGPELQLDDVELTFVQERKERDYQNQQLHLIQFSNSTATQKLLFLGDSHSPDLAAAFLQNINPNLYEIASLGFDDGCFSNQDPRNFFQKVLNKTNYCNEEKLALAKSRLLKNASAILITNYWSPKTLGGFDDGIAFLKTTTSAPIYLIGQNAIFPGLDASLLYQSVDNKKKFNTFFYNHQSVADLSINETLRALAKKHNLIFIDRQPIVCHPERHQCDIFDDQGQANYLDSHHWTPRGRKLFGAQLVKLYPQTLQ